jgi:hypothetical protein
MNEQQRAQAQNTRVVRQLARSVERSFAQEAAGLDGADYRAEKSRAAFAIACREYAMRSNAANQLRHCRG